MIFRLHTVYKNHGNDKNWRLKSAKNRKYIRIYSNNFAAYGTEKFSIHKLSLDKIVTF